MGRRVYTLREDYAARVWHSLDAQTQRDTLDDYGVTGFTMTFLSAFTDNMDARNNGTVTFTPVVGGYVVDDHAKS